VLIPLAPLSVGILLQWHLPIFLILASDGDFPPSLCNTHCEWDERTGAVAVYVIRNFLS